MRGSHVGPSCRAVQGSISCLRCPGSTSCGETCTSLVPAWLSWAPLLQQPRLVLAQRLASSGSAGSPGGALPD